MPTHQPLSPKTIVAAWAAIALALTIPLAALLAHHDLFDWDRDLIEIPALYLAGGLVFAGLAAMPLIPLIDKSANLPKPTAQNLFIFILAFGLIARLAMFATTPALEDDYNRYLWDGAVTANGFNPYARPPAAASAPDAPQSLSQLTRQSGNVFERVNHAELKTIYPPLTQGAFALAHLIKPWSLTAWRAVCLAAEALTLAILLALLHATGRSNFWVALYWWNPVVIKEMINSAHMEAVLTPFVLAALLAAIHKRHLLATAMIGLAAGIKLWPIILAPLVMRPLLAMPRRLAAATLMLAAMCALWLLPPLIGGIDSTSGFVAYATKWKTNSALFPTMEYVVSQLAQPFGVGTLASGLLARLIVGLTLIGVVLWSVAKPISSPTDTMARASAIILALFLLSPAQFPWYLVWVLALMPLRPLLAMSVATVLVPLYYTGFHFSALGTYSIFLNQIVWIIWLPIWATLAYEIYNNTQHRHTPQQ